jgi:hypothetical protein
VSIKLPSDRERSWKRQVVANAAGGRNEDGSDHWWLSVPAILAQLRGDRFAADQSVGGGSGRLQLWPHERILFMRIEIVGGGDQLGLDIVQGSPLAPNGDDFPEHRATNDVQRYVWSCFLCCGHQMRAAGFMDITHV